MSDFGGIQTQTVTIANGASLSGAASLLSYRLHAIVMPAAWTTASITLQASADGTNYFDLYSDGIELELAVAASQYYALLNDERIALSSVRYLKVRSGTSSVAVSQAADRTLTLVLRPIS